MSEVFKKRASEELGLWAQIFSMKEGPLFLGMKPEILSSKYRIEKRHFIINVLLEQIKLGLATRFKNIFQKNAPECQNMVGTIGE